MPPPAASRALGPPPPVRGRRSAFSGRAVSHAGPGRWTVGAFRSPDATLDTDLVQLFCRCGALLRACQVLDAMPSPSMHAYNVLLEAYPPVASLQLLARLLAAEHRPDSEPLDMYAKAGMLDDGMTLRVFDEMPERDSVCCMVTGYARAGRPAEALDLCRRGQVEAMNIENDLHALRVRAMSVQRKGT